MGRPKRAADGGLVYHVLSRSNVRMPIFKKEEDEEAFERILEEVVERTETRLLAYCVLRNHWHLVVWPRSELLLRGGSDLMSHSYQHLHHQHTASEF